MGSSEATARRSPTKEVYDELQHAYDHFNRRLFGGELPTCVITLQRENPRTYGYFSSKRFGHVDGGTTDEIALNPTFFAVVPLVETMQTLVHEMCHLWQEHFGDPGRRKYHNGEWADKMESIGLIPSSTGQPGGKRTGERMALSRTSCSKTSRLTMPRAKISSRICSRMRRARMGYWLSSR